MQATPHLVRKRDGTLEPFARDKIQAAVNKAFLKIQKTSLPDDHLARILVDVEARLLEAHTPVNDNGSHTVSVELLQDCVEHALMVNGPLSVCKEYILYRDSRQKERHGTAYDVAKIPDDVETPWGMVGYVTFKRTYARAVPGRNVNDTETFRETVLRILNACQTQLSIPFTASELHQAYHYMVGLKGIVSGRFLWQLGTDTVNRFGIMSLQNCSFVSIDEPIRPFLFTFDALMLGTGVGVSVQRKHVAKLRPVRNNNDLSSAAITVTRQVTNDADFIVPDKREGWVALLDKVLSAFFETGESFTYSTILIRSRGAPIKGFGGTASGAEDLCTGISNIVTILQSKQGSALSSVDCLDIINIIGSIVVAGNIRRSAIIAIGDPDDIPYLNAKRWDLGNIPNWRAMSNNSVVCDNTSTLPDEFWAGYMGKGEPYGLVNLALARMGGRLQDGGRYPDPDVEGCNPCAEQSLCSYETCCLAEIYLPNIGSFDELCGVGNILYHICKHSLALKCHHRQTQEIVHRNMHMGISVTGYMQATPQQQAWLSDFYEYLRHYDKQYSEQQGFPVSIKLTTVKPSGTLSLLAGVTPGVHPGIYPFFIRRIRMNTANPLAKLCRERGYACEMHLNFDGTKDSNTTVVSFPCKYPGHTVFAKDMTAVQQLEYMVKLNTDYSDNAVSCTVYYRLHELDEIKSWLSRNFQTSVKGCSFLLHSEHGFAQAPYEEITEEQYLEMVSSTTPITEGAILPEDRDDDVLECAQGVCPIK